MQVKNLLSKVFSSPPNHLTFFQTFLQKGFSLSPIPVSSQYCGHHTKLNAYGKMHFYIVLAGYCALFFISSSISIYLYKSSRRVSHFLLIKNINTYYIITYDI